MSDIIKVDAKERKISGTGNSRSLRRSNEVPGIIYGEKKEPILVSLDNKLLKKQIQKPGFFFKSNRTYSRWYNAQSAS